MSTDLFRESPLIQSILQEERLQNTRELVQTALEGRFQTLSADILQALGTADEATLKAIIAHVSSESLEQVRARLGLGPQG
jgi:Tfp pilus assembly ATPase PilU